MEPDIATFSIAALDPHTGALGVAVASKFLAVGAYVPFVRMGVGAVATQARTNLTYGPRALQLLQDGHAPVDASRLVRSDDPDADRRQLGIVSADGSSHTYTGASCTAWAGGVAGPGYAIQGNILAGEQVVNRMEASWLSGQDLEFDIRLLMALQAGEQAGGDRRGRQAAALRVEGAGVSIDLRIDDAPEPVAELSRLLGLWRARRL